MGNLGITRLPTAQIRGSHQLPPYSIFCTAPWNPHPNGFLSHDSQKGVPKLPRLELLQLCGAITSCSASIGMRSKAKLQLSSKAFQQHVTCHLHARKSSRFLTFCGRESNYQFYLPAFLFAITCVANVQMGCANPF